MNEIQIKVFKIEVGQTPPAGRLHMGGGMISVPELGGHKQLLPFT